jgi:hypothetical protein
LNGTSNSEIYATWIKTKDITMFHTNQYITAELSYQDVIDLKQVFDTYDSISLGVLLPNDLKLLLTQNDFAP